MAVWRLSLPAGKLARCMSRASCVRAAVSSVFGLVLEICGMLFYLWRTRCASRLVSAKAADRLADLLEGPVTCSERSPLRPRSAFTLCFSSLSAEAAGWHGMAAAKALSARGAYLQDCPLPPVRRQQQARKRRVAGMCRSAATSAGRSAKKAGGCGGSGSEVLDEAPPRRSRGRAWRRWWLWWRGR